tara:strand:- start:7009 stop:7593 length:585 start_codon:yes stop_codon:yes gene_type:complete
MESVFKKLSEIDIKSKVEKKGSQSYISWSNAWGLVKEKFPTLQRVVYEDPQTGLNYFTDHKTAYVKVGIIIDGLEHIDYLPVMNYKNASIKIEDVTSFDVTKTIQRSMVKAIAMHGLGLQMWSGEDLVQTTKGAAQPTAAAEKVTLNIGDSNWANVVKYIGNNKQLDLNTIVKNLQVKYTISTAVKKELATFMK